MLSDYIVHLLCINKVEVTHFTEHAMAVYVAVNYGVRFYRPFFRQSFVDVMLKLGSR